MLILCASPGDSKSDAIETEATRRAASVTSSAVVAVTAREGLPAVSNLTLRPAVERIFRSSYEPPRDLP
jgi:hypothetical protein